MAALDDVPLAADADVDAYPSEPALDAVDLGVLVDADAFIGKAVEDELGQLGILIGQRFAGLEHHDA